MPFRRSDLQEAFFVPGTYAFRVYGYATTDSLEQVLSQGYFDAARGLLRPGELIYVSLQPQATRGSTAAGGPRTALVMVRADEQESGRATGSVRLVQDFGRASDCPPPLGVAVPQPSAAGPGPAPVKRGRGRPPGSKNKKPAVVAPVA